MSFCGSYRREDVWFLLKPIPIVPMRDLEEKERLIQEGHRHYSEMLSAEQLPSPRYLEVFRRANAANRERMARDCLRLAALIAERRAGPITLVSLARAGTPVGVIVKHLLERVCGRRVEHYSISIIRDRGIDRVALRHILALGHPPESIVFIDGWTGKGVISRELSSALREFNAAQGTAIDTGLYVLSDLAGTAACAASGEDYLIPSSILSATISGLVSRSILNEMIGPNDFHGCVYYSEFESQDLSRWFVDSVVEAAIALAGGDGLPQAEPADRERLSGVSARFLAETLARYGIDDINLVKPGIGEATRVLLRRVPRLLMLRDPTAEDVAHLRVLAEAKSVPRITVPQLPYQAVSLIRSAFDA